MFLSILRSTVRMDGYSYIHVRKVLAPSKGKGEDSGP